MANSGSIYSLADMLVQRRILTRIQADEALKLQRQLNKNFNDILTEKNWVSEEDLVKVEAEVWEIPLLTQEHLEKLDPKLLKSFPKQVCRLYNLFPIRCENSRALIAMFDPFDLIALDNIKKTTQCQPQPVLAAKRIIHAAINKYYGNSAAEQAEESTKPGIPAPPQSSGKPVTEPQAPKKGLFTNPFPPFPAPYRSKPAIEEPVRERAKVSVSPPPQGIKLDLTPFADDNQPIPISISPQLEGTALERVLSRAVSDNASDIHLSAMENGLKVRYRVDSILFELYSSYSVDQKATITSRIKALAELNITEKRLPQDGSFSSWYKNQRIDFRVSTLPTIYGEKIVLRILRKEHRLATASFEALGMDEHLKNVFLRHLALPYGMILITGPSGSGKTTTLYTILNQLKSPEKNLITIEDPIEYRLTGIEQVQIKPDIGFDFSQALRAILRQDLDILMIGEIRDLDSARMAVRSAIGGHMVFSTLHTSDACGAITRLLNLGIEPYMVASSVTLAVAQRLVRKICDRCKESYPAGAREKEILNADENEEVILYRGKGCIYCRNTGYASRTGIFEVLEISQDLMKTIVDSPHTDTIREKAIANGMVTLMQSGIQMVRQGVTTLGEVMRTCMDRS